MIKGTHLGESGRLILSVGPFWLQESSSRRIVVAERQTDCCRSTWREPLGFHARLRGRPARQSAGRSE